MAPIFSPLFLFFYFHFVLLFHFIKKDPYCKIDMIKTSCSPMAGTTNQMPEQHGKAWGMSHACDRDC
jgi:hypothetical protein